MFYTNICSPVKLLSGSFGPHERGLGLDAGRLRPRQDRCARREGERRVGFYKTVLEPLGIPPLWESDRGAQFANLVVWADEPTSGPVHIAFVADSREQVDAFHRAGIEAGYEDNGAPGVREQYSSADAGVYYAAFVFDPDGNNVEAACREF
jgi:catechol 2,3-dioxygenase-like lactoylglutathione lyase family enzyme